MDLEFRSFDGSAYWGSGDEFYCSLCKRPSSSNLDDVDAFEKLDGQLELLPSDFFIPCPLLDTTWSSPLQTTQIKSETLLQLEILWDPVITLCREEVYGRWKQLLASGEATSPVLSRPSDLTLSSNLLRPLPVQRSMCREDTDTHSSPSRFSCVCRFRFSCVCARVDLGFGVEGVLVESELQRSPSLIAFQLPTHWQNRLWDSRVLGNSLLRVFTVW